MTTARPLSAKNENPGKDGCELAVSCIIMVLLLLMMVIMMHRYGDDHSVQ